MIFAFMQQFLRVFVDIHVQDLIFENEVIIHWM